MTTIDDLNHPLSALAIDSNNATSNSIEELTLAHITPERGIVIVVGSLNVVTALIVVGSILWDSQFARRQNQQPEEKIRLHQVKCIYPAEIVPFIISIAVIVQGLIFIIVQSSSLHTVIVLGCRDTAFLIWPAIWCVAYTMLVFGAETAFRSLSHPRFRPRGKGNTLICISVIVLLLFATFLVSLSLPSSNRCLGTLISWTLHYAEIALVLCGSLIFLSLLGAVIVAGQLRRTLDVEREERIAATRVVYYLVLNVVIVALIVPFYAQISKGRVGLSTSQVADIALETSGLLTAIIHLTFRCNADRLAIRSSATPWGKKRRLRFFGPNNLTTGLVVSTPLLSARNDRPTNTFFSDQNPLYLTKPTMNSTSPYIQRVSLIPPKARHSVTPLQLTRTHLQPPQTRSTYSIFPAAASTQHLSMSTTTSTWDIETLPFPAPLFSRKHRRDESNNTTETVQIGMRLSHAIVANTNSSPTPYELPISIAPTPTSIPHHNLLLSQLSTIEPFRSDHLRPPSSQCSLHTFWAVKRDSLVQPELRQMRLMKSLPSIPQPPTSVQLSSRLRSLSRNDGNWPLPNVELRNGADWI